MGIEGRREKKSSPKGAFTEEEGLEPPSLTAAVFKTADLPISLFLQLVRYFAFCAKLTIFYMLWPIKLTILI